MRYQTTGDAYTKSILPVKNIPLRFISVLLASATIALPRLAADESDDIKALRSQVDSLEQQIRVIERKEEIKSEDAAAAAKAAPTVSFTDKGFVFASGDGANSLHLGTLVQLDSREFFGDGGGVQNNSFILRRARIVIDGKLDKIYSFQFVPEFGNGSGGTATAVAILDANLTIAPTQAVQFKFGKFKTPIGLEVLQSDSATFFVERSLVSNLEPNRDLGAQVCGVIDGGFVNYSIGLFNGIPDALTSSGNSDFDNEKDVDGRLFLKPFVNDKDSFLQGLGFGVAGGLGREKTTAAVTGGYKTAGQQTFFKYNSAVFADGDVWRISPQSYYCVGPFGVLAEYVVSTVNVRPSGPSTTAPKVQLENKAWAVTAGYVLTGESSSYDGITPAAPFNWDNGTWGAWQVVARYEDLKIDPNAFAGTGAAQLASPATNAKEASAWGVGVNWYLTKAVRISQDFFDTHFKNAGLAAPTTQILQHNEKALTTRVQLSF
ncbi:MAG TPA: porin [Opitutaceae bacterium]|jgi:phosphate-selective porin OprO/OprP|nr:porin [Opitutaceae bacterium]